MHAGIRGAELFHTLHPDAVERLATIGRRLALRTGECLFFLGDSAQNVSVVTSGQLDLCLPVSFGGVTKDIVVETAGPGKTVGWSALVTPFRFTLSAKAREASEVIAFSRQELTQLFEADPETERVVLRRISELIGNRLTTFQALWARELQRRLERAAEITG